MSSWIVKSCSLLFCWTPLWRSLMGNLMLGFTIWEVNWETTMSHLSLPSFSLVQCTVQSVYRFSLSLWSATAISDVARACRSKKLSTGAWSLGCKCTTPSIVFWGKFVLPVLLSINRRIRETSCIRDSCQLSQHWNIHFLLKISTYNNANLVFRLFNVWSAGEDIACAILKFETGKNVKKSLRNGPVLVERNYCACFEYCKSVRQFCSLQTAETIFQKPLEWYDFAQPAFFKHLPACILFSTGLNVAWFLGSFFGLISVPFSFF